MTTLIEIAFGPVPSRRLGRSLGINNVPPKHCSYSCVYCQLGPTLDRELVPRSFYAPEEVCRQVTPRVEAIRASGQDVDYLSFVPDGEPTLDAGLAASIEGLRPLGIPIAVITNASLIWREEVRAALNRADWVSLKVDSVDESTWRQINRPHPDLRLPAILDGIRTFVRGHAGTVVSETMLVEGLNDAADSIEAVGRFLEESGIRTAYLAVPTRPPSVGGTRGPDESVVNRAYHILTAHVPAVELLTGYEGDAFASSGDARADLLAITAVHPMRESAVRALLIKTGSPWSLLEELVATGVLRQLEYRGEVFYIRSLR